MATVSNYSDDNIINLNLFLTSWIASTDLFIFLHKCILLIPFHIKFKVIWIFISTILIFVIEKVCNWQQIDNKQAEDPDQTEQSQEQFSVARLDTEFGDAILSSQAVNTAAVLLCCSLNK